MKQKSVIGSVFSGQANKALAGGAVPLAALALVSVVTGTISWAFPTFPLDILGNIEIVLTWALMTVGGLLSVYFVPNARSVQEQKQGVAKADVSIPD